MGSKSAAKSNRGKIVGTSGGGKTSGKSGKEKQTQSDESDEVKDLSVLRKSVGTSISGLQDVLEVYQTGTQEVRSILARECKIIYECRVCENLFRSIANLISHKRIYCQEVAKPSYPPSLPNGIVPHNNQPTSTSEDSSVDIVIVEPEPPVKRQRSNSPEQWICNESTPDPDSVAPEELPKLEFSVPPIRRRKDICSVIEKLTKRASRQNLANATAVAAHYAAITKTPFSLANPVTLPTSKTLYMESIAETKNAVYQTMLSKVSSSVKISQSENSEMITLREFGRSNSKDLDNLTMSGSLFSLPSDAFPSFKEPLPRLKSPVPHDLLIKKRVSHLKEITSQNEKVVLDPDGVVIPNVPNGPMYPPEVFSGNVSNSEGEEQDEEDDAEEVNVMPKMRAKSTASKDTASEDKEEIVCSICKARFSTRKTLTHHMKSLHVMFRTYYRCPCCKKIFANNWSVYRHLYKVHRKSTDQVRKLRALIKKKAFRKKILLPLPNSSETPASADSNADTSKEEMSSVEFSVGLSKVSSSSSTKQSSSSLPSASRMPSGPGRSSSPLPPPSEATQYPAISAQHAQVLRKLENIVKEDRRSAECYPEFPGVGQSCPGCGRRFERRAALASHVHSCYKQVLLAAQKAKRAINKQPQPKKTTRAGVKSGAGSEETEKGYQDSRESAAKDSALANAKKCGSIKEEGNTSGPLEEIEEPETCLDERQQDASLSRVSRLQSMNQMSLKSTSEFSSSTYIAGSSSRSSSDLALDKIKEEDWDEIERPNSALSICTHQDSCSPLTLANQTGKQQRIAIQIRRDYVKGDRGSASSSGASPVPYTVVQSSKLEDDPDEEDLIIPSSYSKNPPEDSPESCKQSLTSMTESCSDLVENENPQFSLEDKKPFDKRELVLQLEDILNKRSPENDGTFHLERDNILTEHSVGSIKEKEDELYDKCEMEGVIGSHGEVKRVFLEGFVVGVADPNSLAVDDEENDKVLEEKAHEPKMEKELGGSNQKQIAAVKTKVSSSLITAHSQRGRPVRNRVKVEREDFIYDLSDMRLSPAKKEDTNPVSSHSSSVTLKRPRRNNLQQQLVSNSSQGSSSSFVENSSSIKQSSSASASGGSTCLPGKGNVCSMQSQEKLSESVGGSSGVPKLSDCRVVIGGLRSGDMKQLSVRRVYTSRKILTPSNATPVACEVGAQECNSLKKVGRSKECPLGPSNVDAGLFGEMGKGETPLPKKQIGKTSVLYQNDSLDSTDS